MEAVTWLPYASTIWLIAKDYELTRMEFMYLAEAGISCGLVSPDQVRMSLNKYQPSALRSISGCVVETKTLADFRKLAAKPTDLVIVCEPGLIDNLSLVVELLWGRVSEKRGCILLAGTSDEASEEWYELWESYAKPNPAGGKSFSIPTWANKYNYPKGRDEREFRIYQELYGEEALMAHYGGVPSSPRDLVLRGFWLPSIHVSDKVEFNPNLPVEIAIDPNYSMGHRYAVEVIQWSWETNQIWLVDEVAQEGLTHDQIRDICTGREWWRYVQGGVIDPYAGESHVYGSPTPISYWHPLALRHENRPRVNTTVQAIKEALSTAKGEPRLLISPKAERFLYEAPRWRQNKTGKPSDANCDALKATGYWLVDHFGEERAEESEDNVVAIDWQIE